MCRILSYLGTPVLLDDLLYAPDSSLLNQTIGAQMLQMLNLAGFGMAAWDEASHAPTCPSAIARRKSRCSTAISRRWPESCVHPHC
ncbi:hypothetical protein [Novosphingobium sp. THN1]|uniref:hypothetical protein n=1 Tax=Novosphingobium sp. THN1 TaxID=1016987 RepID=UPI0013C314FE|nr:hypothetical protein [Novosphingobium sp. THN1]